MSLKDKTNSVEDGASCTPGRIGIESAGNDEIEDPKGSATSELEREDCLNRFSHDEMTECQIFLDMCLGSPKSEETLLQPRNHEIESSENENTVFVEDGESKSPVKIGMVDQETLNSSVDIESLIEDESQIVSENEIVENSERIHIHYSEHESSTELITGPEGIVFEIYVSFPDSHSRSSKSLERCLNNHVILTRIFQFLPLFSRKQIRLVCKTWNEACNHPVITKHEVIAIPSPYRSVLSDVFSTLIQSKRSIINLKFKLRSRSLFYDCESRNFWQQHGFKIRSLDFPEGDLEADDIVQVLKCCLNVQELRIPEIPACTKYNIWAKLLDNHVVFKEMTSLYLCTEINPSRKCSTMNEAFPIIFPNVKELEIKYRLEEPTRGPRYQQKSLLDSSTREMQGLVDAVLPLDSKLKSFHLRFEMEEYITGFWEPVSDVVSLIKQLKTLEIPMDYIIKWPNVSDFKKFENLTSLTLNSEYSASDILIPVLDNIPELRHAATINDWVDHVIFDENLMNRIISSKLESLLIYGSVYSAEGILKADRNVYNDTLQSFDMEFGLPAECKREMKLFLIKNFRNLKEIKFARKMTGSLLQDVFTHHKNLRVLSACSTDIDLKCSMGCPECNKNGPEQFYSFCRFQYLEDLFLRISIRSNEKYSFSGFVLPQLKFLEVQLLDGESKGCQKLSHYKNLSSFLHAVEEMPRLEYFKLYYWHTVPFSFLLRQCESHESLKFLLFECGSSKVEDSEFLEHKYAFKVCQSLRCIEYKGATFFRNVITKKVEQLSFEKKRELLEASHFY